MSEQEIVKKLLSEGYAFPCACCKHLWRTRSRGLYQCEVAFMPGKECGGPIANMSFPLYEGPLTLSALATRCFRCGEKADEAVSTRKNPDRMVGACKKHMPMLERLVDTEWPVKAAG